MMKSQKSLSSTTTAKKFQLWAESADLDDLKAALTSLNLIYQMRVTTKPLHANQFKQLAAPVDKNKTTVTYYQVEDDDDTIDETLLFLTFVQWWSYYTKWDFSHYFQKVKREVRRPHLNTHCPCCGVKMTQPSVPAPTSLTIDHIIPVWVCEALDYYQGIVDPKNMRVMCFSCNSKRGARITTIADLRKDLGNKVVDAFFRKVNAYLPLTFNHFS